MESVKERKEKIRLSKKRVENETEKYTTKED